jgi:hypothetical protein
VQTEVLVAIKEDILELISELLCDIYSDGYNVCCLLCKNVEW